MRPHYPTKNMVIGASFGWIYDQKGELWTKKKEKKKGSKEINFTEWCDLKFLMRQVMVSSHSPGI